MSLLTQYDEWTGIVFDISEEERQAALGGGGGTPESPWAGVNKSDLIYYVYAGALSEPDYVAELQRRKEGLTPTQAGYELAQEKRRIETSTAKTRQNYLAYIDQIKAGMQGEAAAAPTGPRPYAPTAPFPASEAFRREHPLPSETFPSAASAAAESPAGADPRAEAWAAVQQSYGALIKNVKTDTKGRVVSFDLYNPESQLAHHIVWGGAADGFVPTDAQPFQLKRELPVTDLLTTLTGIKGGLATEGPLAGQNTYDVGRGGPTGETLQPQSIVDLLTPSGGLAPLQASSYAPDLNNPAGQTLTDYLSSLGGDAGYIPVGMQNEATGMPALEMRSPQFGGRTESLGMIKPQDALALIGRRDQLLASGVPPDRIGDALAAETGYRGRALGFVPGNISEADVQHEVQRRYLEGMGSATEKRFATGGSFVATKPTRILVGEGSMPERVNIQPLTGPAAAAEQAGRQRFEEIRRRLLGPVVTPTLPSRENVIAGTFQRFNALNPAFQVAPPDFAALQARLALGGTQTPPQTGGPFLANSPAPGGSAAPAQNFTTGYEGDRSGGGQYWDTVVRGQMQMELDRQAQAEQQAAADAAYGQNLAAFRGQFGETLAQNLSGANRTLADVYGSAGTPPAPVPDNVARWLLGVAPNDLTSMADWLQQEQRRNAELATMGPIERARFPVLSGPMPALAGQRAGSPQGRFLGSTQPSRLREIANWLSGRSGSPARAWMP